MANDPYRYFRVEAPELLDGLVKGVLELDKGAPAATPVAQLLRLAHTLKGAARVVKQREIADRAHAVEDVLAPYREAAGPVPRDRLDLVLRLLDEIGAMVAALAMPAEVVASSPRPGQPEEIPRGVRPEVADVDALLDGVGELGALLGALRSGIEGMARARGLVDLVVQQLAPSAARDVEGHGGGASRAKARETVEELRALVVALDQRLGYGVEQVDRELRQVREAGERLRLVPARVLFTDLERAARDVAQAQGKQVVFEGRGGDVRLDARVLGVVQGALQQVVRNAVAHGIEPDRERLEAGKPPGGRVLLEVARRGRRVVFTCRDDGRGVDLAAVSSTLRRKGLLPAPTQNLAAEALLRLLLEGGVSTSGTVTEVSGRGVGLDVVRDAVERLGGKVAASTESGAGTTIELDVPLSLASLEALVVEAGGAALTIPLDAVRGTVRVTADEVVATPQGWTLLHQGRSIPFLPLAVALSGTRSPVRAAGSWSVAIVEGRGGMAAVGADRLLGTSNVVMRPLPDLAPAAAVVAGASVDVRGDPQLVLDPDGLVAETQRAGAVGVDAEPPRTPILVVDDSLTTRMLEQSILESAGYDVEVAASAEEALAKALDSRYALFLVDVEMPGMDGFAFVERTRASSTLRDVPCVLVTSRSSPEDRRRGLEVGARAYVTKSEFNQGEFLECVGQLVAR
jgi:two-component system, chemotaxis family, sensor kinase CheA